MIALIFQLAGAILLANTSVKYKTVSIPVTGEKLPGLKEFLKNKWSLSIGLFYVIIGYALQIVGKDVLVTDFIIRIGISTPSIFLLVFIGHRVAKSISTKQYDKSFD